MEQQEVAAVLVAAPCLPSKPMARLLRTYIISRVSLVPIRLTVMELFRTADSFYRAPPCMGRLLWAVVREMGRFSPSTPMARVLPTCIVSRRLIPRLAPIATENGLLPEWFRRATPCMGQHRLEAVTVMARSLALAPMAQVLRTCMISLTTITTHSAV